MNVYFNYDYNKNDLKMGFICQLIYTGKKPKIAKRIFNLLQLFIDHLSFSLNLSLIIGFYFKIFSLNINSHDCAFK